jgi:beta-lactamase class A
VIPLEAAKEGWQKVKLADGRVGFVPAAIPVPQPLEPVSRDEDVLRRRLVEAALSYSGTHYRWGGKSPQGIDCSGLCSMAYMLCGILIFRDADIREGFPIRQIPLEQMKPGDLIFFPGHVAMYIGDDRYCHSTAKVGFNGFAVNSLNPSHPDYREDLHKTITKIGSYF